MTGLVVNFNQISQLLGAVFVPGIVGDAGGQIPVVTNNGSQLDGALNNGCRLANAGTNFTLDVVYSAYYTLPAPLDLSGDKQALIMHYQNTTNFSSTGMKLALGGVRLYLTSGAGFSNYARYDGNGFHGLNWIPLIAGATATPALTVGTFDITNVTSIGIGWQARNSGSFTCEFSLSQLLMVDNLPLFSDTNSDPTTFSDFITLLSPGGGETYHSGVIKQAGPTAEIGIPFNITARNFLDSGPLGVSFLNDGITYIPSNVDAAFWEFALTPPIGGTIELANLTVATNSNIYDVNIDASDGDCSLTSTLITTCSDVIITGANLTTRSTVISNPVNIDISDSDLIITILNSTNAIQWSGDLTSGSVVTTDSNIDILFDVGDYSDVDFIFTGNNTATFNPTTDLDTYIISNWVNTGSSTIFDIPTGNTLDTTVKLDPSFTATRINPTSGGGEIILDNTAVVNVAVTVIDQVTQLPIENAAVYLELGTGGPGVAGTLVMNTLTDVNGEASTTATFTSDQPIIGRVRKSSATPFYTNFPLSGNIIVSGFNTTVLMSRED